jgi:hypothetical protein
MRVYEVENFMRKRRLNHYVSTFSRPSPFTLGLFTPNILPVNSLSPLSPCALVSLLPLLRTRSFYSNFFVNPIPSFFRNTFNPILLFSSISVFRNHINPYLSHLRLVRNLKGGINLHKTTSNLIHEFQIPNVDR